jgi:hypothetical protein
MVIGLAQAMRARGLNPQQQLHVTAIDKDPTAAHMCFVQLSLLGLPAVVHVGDTLRLEFREAYRTPFHHLGLWEWKLNAKRGRPPTPVVALPKCAVSPPPANDLSPPALRPAAGQLSLF